MSLPSGTRLGPYEILAPIGAGGMGEVYRARDERLKRDVAIKVIHPAFAANEERLARFEQEAYAAAALNHPNILAVYDVGATNGEPYVVSELLDGTTLREVLIQGALTMSKAIDIATQVAMGLAAAHTKGVTHRDIKPENVFVTHEGRAKILDFGLAKLREDAGGSSQATRLRASTEPGVVLGTVGYMSPEQVRGHTCDARSDIFSLGVVLFEMLAGTRPFRGESAVETMNAILKEDPPDLSSSTGKLTPSLDRIVKHCLEKNPGERFQSAQDLAFALQSAAPGGSGSVSASTATPTASGTRGTRELVAWTIAALSLLAALGLAAYVYSRPRDTVTLTRASIPLPDGASITRPPARPSPIAVSPDGRSLVFVASQGGVAALWVRPLDGTGATKLNGTEGAAGPFWSPDSRWIAFFADGRLKRIALTGGDPQVICATNGLGGGTWNKEDVILFSPSDVGEGGLVRVSAAGGAVSAVTELDRARAETNHIWPQFLPDGRRFVYNSVGRENPGIYVGSLDAPGRTLLVPFTDRTDVGVSTLAYAPGYLLYVHNETLLAQPMDAGSGRLSGQAVPIAEGIAKVGPGSAAFSVSATGTLAYWDGSSVPTSQLTWLSRDGTVVGRSGPPGGYTDLALSSDQRRIAVGRVDRGRQSAIWVWDTTRETFERLTTDSLSQRPAWAPDNASVVYATARDGPPALYRKAINSAAPDQLVFKSTGSNLPSDWCTSEGILFQSRDPKTLLDIWRIAPNGDRAPVAIMRTPFNEREARCSPGGKWLAYSSDESGRSEVYVTTLPDASGKWPISTSGGQQPLWRGAGAELFYLALDGTIMAVPIRSGSIFEAGAAKPLFQIRGTSYAVSADGQRFLTNDPIEAANARPITIVLNWTAALAK